MLAVDHCAMDVTDQVLKRFVLRSDANPTVSEDDVFVDRSMMVLKVDAENVVGQRPQPPLRHLHLSVPSIVASDIFADRNRLDSMSTVVSISYGDLLIHLQARNY